MDLRRFLTHKNQPVKTEPAQTASSSVKTEELLQPADDVNPSPTKKVKTENADDEESFDAFLDDDLDLTGIDGV